ncbi:MAG: hypothetical protein ABL866_16855 [Devosia sp.]
MSATAGDAALVVNRDLANEIDALAARHPEIPAGVVNAAQVLLGAVPIPPASISRGYNPTICFYWSTTRPIEVEVTPTDFEYYELGPTVDIRHFPHGGEPVISPDLLALLLLAALLQKSPHP